MIQLINQIKWQFLIFQKNNLMAMVVGIAGFYALIIYLVREFENIDKFITLLIYNDPAVVGFAFIGVSMISEKDQGVFSALFVTPVKPHFYLISKVFALSTLGFFGALAIVLTAKGTSVNLLHFSVGAFSTCVLFCFMGIFIICFTKEVLHYLLRGLPLLIFMSLPLLNYFELTEMGVLKFFPIQGGLNLMINSYRKQPNLGELVFGYVSIVAWTPLIYWFVYRTFIYRVVKV
jgi:fluoroquinolone transport system permease protein